MKAIIATRRSYPQVLKRLQALGWRVDTKAPDKVKTLDPHLLEDVVLVPFADLADEEWAETRVRLARANRYFIVFGSGLQSRDMMHAARDGAHDVLVTEDDDPRWQEALESSASSQALWWQLYGGQGEVDEKHLVGRSAAMHALRESVQRIGPTNASVLVMGESGTGKERVAEAVHAASGKGAFVAVNCAAIPAELLESELFGAEKGAFTGANQAKPGLVEEASGGTLFLDEIGEMPLALQPKLLRFLETRRARRVGSTKEYQCDVRLIAATNRDLLEESGAGRFRPDLYYRLGEVVLNLPPLRERVEDIPDLARLFMGAAAERMGKNFESAEPELIYKFQLHDWPGNVRELKQSIERIAIHYDGPVMRAPWWEVPRSTRRPTAQEAPPPQPPAPAAENFAPSPTLFPNKRQRFEMAKRLMEESGGDMTWTAAQMGIHPTTLYRWKKTGKI